MIRPIDLSTYPSKPHRTIPDGAIALIERTSDNGKWVDLLAVMPNGTRIYVTTKPNTTPCKHDS